MKNTAERSEDERQVLNLVDRFNDAMVAGDMEKYFSFCDDDFSIFIPGSPYRIDGIAYDREELVLSLKAKRFFFFEELQPLVQLHGTTAIVSYHARTAIGSTEQDASTLYLKETDVLVKKPEGWKIVHIHVSTPGGASWHK